MQRLKSRRRKMSDINVVPYIDVMLVLLIIFMVTTPLLTQGVKVSLPHAQAKVMSPTTQPPLVVTVNAKGEYFSNLSVNPRRPISATQLQLQIKQTLARDPARKIYVRGDTDAEYGQVVQAMVIMQHAGAQSVGLVTDDQQTHRS